MICCFFENLAVNGFTFTALRSADKFLNEQQIFGLTLIIFNYFSLQLPERTMSAVGSTVFDRPSFIGLSRGKAKDLLPYPKFGHK